MTAQCTRPPRGWWCSRESGHEGPCAALSNITRDSLQDRIAEYLSTGGLFNPELAQHDKVRDLLIDVRNFLWSLEWNKDILVVERLKFGMEHDKYILENDDSGHWYVIPKAQEDHWSRWIGSQDWDSGIVPPYAVPCGAPQRVTFGSFVIE